MDQRYTVLNAAEKVDGYYFPAPHESALGKLEVAFDRAKAECIKNLLGQIEDIKNLTFAQFKQPKKYLG